VLWVDHQRQHDLRRVRGRRGLEDVEQRLELDAADRLQVTTRSAASGPLPGSDLVGLTNATIRVGLGEGNTASDSIDGPAF
jgi:hypothetical protein